jgi:hypothetical protein
VKIKSKIKIIIKKKIMNEIEINNLKNEVTIEIKTQKEMMKILKIKITQITDK